MRKLFLSNTSAKNRTTIPVKTGEKVDSVKVKKKMDFPEWDWNIKTDTKWEDAK
jgi:hypothetical protein